MGSKHAGETSPLVSEHVAAQCAGQGCAITAGERLIIGFQPPVEVPCKLMHALWHAEVAHAGFAQSCIEVAEKLVGERLGQGLGARRATQPPEGKCCVKRNYLKPPLKRVRDPVFPKKLWLAARTHDHGEKRRGIPLGAACSERPHHPAFPPCPLGRSALGLKPVSKLREGPSNMNSGLLRLSAAVAVIVASAACAPVQSYNGFRADYNNQEIPVPQVGVDTQQTVLQRFGSPSTTAIFDTTAWYYVSSVQERVAFYNPRITERRVMVVRFDGETVTAVDSFGLERGRIVSYATEETPTRGRELGVLEQLLGNVGRTPPIRPEAEDPRDRR